MPNSRKSAWTRSPLNLLRGGLIGTAEVVPGVSGGTVALVTGVYETLIGSADHLLSGLRLLIAAPFRGGDLAGARAHLRQVEWRAIVPILAGMAAAVLVAARLLEPVLHDSPRASRALFAGMILASLVVPLRAIGDRLAGRDWLLLAVAAAATALATGVPPATVRDPMLLLVACAAAFAICALVLPGVSGSFLLLTAGLYAPTIAAVNDRNLGYLAAFAVGALVGLALFVKVLRWLLAHRRRGTLVVMTGLMLGSLRALWPWQDVNRTLQAPGGDVAPIAGLALVGVTAVLALVALEHKLHGRAAPPVADTERAGAGPPAGRPG